MNTHAKILGQKLRRMRQQRSYSQEYLAELAGLHPTYIGQVERGEKNLTIESLFKIADALDCPVAELFDRMPAGDAALDYPWQAYELVASLDAGAQQRMLRILQDICRLYHRTE